MRYEVTLALLVFAAGAACAPPTDSQPAAPSAATVARGEAGVAPSGSGAGTPAPAPIIQPSSSPDTPTRVLDARADDILKAMSTFIAATERFAFEAEETYDELPGGAPRMLLSNVRRIAVERPRRFFADVEGDSLNRSVWLDGKAVFTLDKPTLTYSTFESPGTIDATIDTLIDKYGLNIPLAELFYTNAYNVLTEQVTYSRYLGLHRAAGVPCHHLVFSQPTIEWQIWIEAGEQPLPRKMVVTYVREPGEPQYIATITKWNLMPTFPEGLFSFDVPEGAERVDASALIPSLPGSAR